MYSSSMFLYADPNLLVNIRKLDRRCQYLALEMATKHGYVLFSTQILLSKRPSFHGEAARHDHSHQW